MTTDAPKIGLRSAISGGRSHAVLDALRSAPRWLLGSLRSGTWVEAGLVTAVLIGLVMVRLQLGPWRSGDFNMFLVNWFEYLRLHGFHGLGDEFANYNMPYLYLLYAGSLITPDGLACVKIVGALSDLALALGCFAVLRQLGAQRELATVAGAGALLLPEVLLNSAAWGQADSTYSALLVWALWSALRGRGRTTWILFALAFTFKLQAAFVLPAVTVLHVTRRWGWQGPALGICTVLLTEVPALVAGRSPASLIAIYFDQASTTATLTMNAPSLYALLPESEHDVIRASGMYLALASVALVSYVVLRAARRRPLVGSTVLLFVAVLAALAPFTLPTMHERYFYVGNVLLFLYAVVTRRLLPWAVVAQVVALSAYSPFLFGTGPVLPMGQLALIQGAVLFVMIRQLVRESGAFPLPEPNRRDAAGAATA